MSTWRSVTPHATEFLNAAAASSEGVLLALDFDGTLAPIVEDPLDSRFYEPAAEALGDLGPRVGKIAIITGRGVAVVRDLGQLQGRRGLDNLVVLGQYGVERWDAATGEETSPEVPSEVQAVRAEVDRLVAECPYRGVTVEDKGRALGIHTRRSDDPDGAFRDLKPKLRTLAEERGLVLEPGRNVLEIRASSTTKGQALLELADGMGATAVAFCGDDLGDLPAFEALAELRGRGVVTCAVVSGSDEQPEVARHADVLAEGPQGVADWLAELANRLN
ncbi:trehalose-phosphatase [Tessaracoccus flavus]|uniref:Trehalose 6-phosphate phosphatase n=1 Tax=Tessaracoccus flavus TaxID=1610493 RepID=A0A1Q2CDS9_9ACTN|nr:trehalose-phosphatase [Tessaracoccus flavus]AQP44274.1 trehalose-phosphatase [Tessaracoccus flavus]SDY40298.1 trehalose 6-phosphatase [Tessaracoccus flavus]